ncbi:hypothetical protein [uncultured Limosilactobacillus sp.]|uniref:hypothetical protein n=1 Tax=uncultured Limosilactobacillus sp. TaxID=2837629 RepID=UPI0025FD579D|nr:hypothetical protein [uncultured Limosilactobacillus sp.]
MNYAEYLTYFRQMISQRIEWQVVEGTKQPVYDQLMRSFADFFERSLDYNPQYLQTLRAAEIKPRIDHETVGQVMLSNDDHLVKAMLSMIIDGENKRKGTWANALTEGYFFQLVSALCPATAIAG